MVNHKSQMTLCIINPIIQITIRFIETNNCHGDRMSVTRQFDNFMILSGSMIA